MFPPQLPLPLTAALLLAFFVGVPLLVLFLGSRSALRGATSRRRAVGGLAAAAALAVLVPVGWTLSRMAPGHSRVLATGTADDGVDYCLVQSYNGYPEGLTEPYRISLYARTAGSSWNWHYVDHQALAWTSGRVEFADGRALVAEPGSSPVEVPLALADRVSRSGGAFESLPASLTAEDVARRHHQVSGRFR